MPNNSIILPWALGDNGLPSDPHFQKNLLLFRSDKGLIDLMGKSVFDTKTASLTDTYSKFGPQSLQFDGTNAKRFESSAGVGTRVTDTGWTMDAWVYVDGSAAVDRAIISSQTTESPGNVLFYITSAGKLAVYNNVQRILSAGVVVPNAWNHLGVTKNGLTSSSLWINGNGENFSGNWNGDFNGTGGYATTPGFAIGSRIGGSVVHKGAIDSVRVTQAIRWTANFIPTQFPDQ